MNDEQWKECISWCEKGDWSKVIPILPRVQESCSEKFADIMSYAIARDEVLVVQILMDNYNVDISKFHSNLLISCDAVHIANFLYNRRGFLGFEEKKHKIYTKALGDNAFNLIYFLLTNNIVPYNDEILSEILWTTESEPEIYASAEYILEHAIWDKLNIDEYKELNWPSHLLMPFVKCVARHDYLAFVENRTNFEEKFQANGETLDVFFENASGTVEECRIMI